ncbi:hypothetical protein COT72_01940 [archaeon CG10_big_fil_rev_8_21_14_0_10_43_11]|nr:MAG: hypothetical protein COT72_01940 [archaeon CG10_big_fil_rev_8_21_14_0_10_43_11]
MGFQHQIEGKKTTMATIDYNQTDFDYEQMHELLLPHYQQVWNKIKQVTKKTVKRLIKDPLFLASLVTMPFAYSMNDKVTHGAMGVAAYKVIDTISDEIGAPGYLSKTAGILGALATGVGWEVMQGYCANTPVLSSTPLAGVVDPLDAEATTLGGLATGTLYATKDAINAKRGKNKASDLEQLLEA